MKSYREFVIGIRKRETPLYDRLYRIAKFFHGLSVPTIHPLHGLLYHEWTARTSLWHHFWRVVYYEPIFKSQCQKVGKGFRMEYAGNGSAKIFGNLQVYLGENVTIFDNTYLVGRKVHDKPELRVGDNTYLGPIVRIIVGNKITIGSRCLIGSTLIADNPGHPFTDVMARITQRSGGSPEPDSIRPIKIGDFCFLGIESVVYPGVTIGDGAVVTVGTHVGRDVPPFCLVSGNPMKIRMKLPIPAELIAIVGENRYREYLELHKQVKLHR